MPKKSVFHPKERRLLARFRHMLVASHVAKEPLTEEKLLGFAKGKTRKEKLHSIEMVLLLLPVTEKTNGKRPAR